MNCNFGRFCVCFTVYLHWLSKKISVSSKCNMFPGSYNSMFRIFFSQFRLLHEIIFSVPVFDANVLLLWLEFCLQKSTANDTQAILVHQMPCGSFLKWLASIFKLIESSNCHWKEEISVLYMEKQLLFFFPNGFSGMKAVQVIWIVTAIILREPISSYCETPPLFFFFFLFFPPFRRCP